MKARLPILFLLLSCVVLASAAARSAFAQATVFAQAAVAGPVEIFPEQLNLQTLPLPGAPIIVKAKLSNTKDTERRLRALVVRDGKLSDVAPLKSYLDEYDQPTYEMQFFSPLAELSYQFVLYNPDGSFSTTPRLSVRRNCIPFIDLNKIKLEPKSQGEARLEALVKLSRGLEREISTYDVALKIIDSLNEKFKQ